MGLLANGTPSVLWKDLIKHAEKRCAITLEEELEAYLVSLLVRYTNRPDVVKKLVATAFLEALQEQRGNQRNVSLQYVGDQCLLFTGLFPRIAEKRHVKIAYFVDLGRSAYAAITGKDDLYGSLAVQFVVLMDVLQSIRQTPTLDLLPLEAYDLWTDVGSKRAFKILQQYSSTLLEKPDKH